MRGISLSDIAKITKIGLSSLQALEDDRLNILPGEFFIKGMIKAYAKVVGLDEDQVLTLYKHSLQQKELDRAQEARRRESPILPSRKPNTLLVGVAVIFLLAVSAMIILGFALKRTPSRNLAEAKPQPASSAEVSKSPLPSSPQPVTQENKSEGIILRLTFQQDAWIQVMADGQVVLDQVKRTGEVSTFTCRREFILTTGNAGGFSYTLNGQAGKPLGSPGAVVRNVRIGLDNLRDFLGAH